MLNGLGFSNGDSVMTKITSLDGLHRLRIELVVKRNEEAQHGTIYVRVGTGTCGIAVGALEVLRSVETEIKTLQLKDVVVAEIGCIGLCSHEPILEVVVGKAPKVAYGKVDPERVKRIVREHIIGGKPVQEFIINATPFPTI